MSDQRTKNAVHVAEGALDIVIDEVEYAVRCALRPVVPRCEPAVRQALIDSLSHLYDVRDLLEIARPQPAPEAD
jgi:hypothetical protein